MRKFLFAAAMGLAALAAVPANAQAYQGTPPPPEGYYDDGYTGPDEWTVDDGERTGNGYVEVEVATGGYVDNGYTSGPRRYRPGDYYEGGGSALNGDLRRYAQRDRPRRCGNTGAILGGIAGALLGGEIGRGNSRWSRRSDTGTVVGAGVGALIGNDIDRQNCEGRR